MHITTFNLDENKPCPIDEQLRRLAADTEPLKTAYWQKLLDLITHFQAVDSEHELMCDILFQDLLLDEPEPSDPIREMQIRRFIDKWRSLNPKPEDWRDSFDSEMSRRFPLKPGIRISVRVDWRDRAPLRDGLPEMHYRFQIERPGKTISEDARAKDVVEAERVIFEAFGW